MQSINNCIMRAKCSIAMKQTALERKNHKLYKSQVGVVWHTG